MGNAATIKAQLWEMANKLRGTMDASEYKNYILPFMFYRYLSENQDRYLYENHLEDFFNITDKEELDEYLQEISGNLGYAIEPEYRWEMIVSKIENHKIKASDFQDLFDAFNKNAKRNAFAAGDFANVFSDVNLGDTRLGSSTNERAKALNDIVLMINDFVFQDESGHDILGDVYEYLIGQFAANAGKKGGEFYTPHEVSQILAKIVTLDAENGEEQFRVYDPAMGSGSLLLTVQKELPGGNKNGAVEFYGQELNTTTYNLARMNLMMHDVNYRNIVETYKKRDEIEKFSHVASLDEIKENEYNLNIPRYVDTFEEEEAVPLTDIASELVSVRAEIDEATKSLMEMLGELSGQTPEVDKELKKFIELLTE